MDLETKQKHNGWETLKTKTTANKKRAMVRNFKTEPHKEITDNGNYEHYTLFEYFDPSYQYAYSPYCSLYI